MRNEQKSAFQKDRIQKLRHENATLREELLAMDIRNKELIKENDALMASIDSMKANHDKAMTEHMDAIAQAKKAKEEYEQMVSEVRLLKHDYENQIAELIRRIRDLR